MSGTVDLTGKIKQKSVTPENPGFYLLDAGDVDGNMGISVASIADRDIIPEYMRPNCTTVTIGSSTYKYIYEKVNDVYLDRYGDASWVDVNSWSEVPNVSTAIKNYLLNPYFKPDANGNINQWLSFDATLVSSKGVATFSDGGIYPGTSYLYGFYDITEIGEADNEIVFTALITNNKTGNGYFTMGSTAYVPDGETSITVQATNISGTQNTLAAGESRQITYRFKFPSDVRGATLARIIVSENDPEWSIENPIVTTPANYELLKYVIHDDVNVDGNWIFDNPTVFDETIVANKTITIAPESISAITVNGVESSSHYKVKPLIHHITPDQHNHGFLKIETPEVYKVYYVADYDFGGIVSYKDYFTGSVHVKEYVNTGSISTSPASQVNKYTIPDWDAAMQSTGGVDISFIYNRMENGGDNFGALPEDAILESWIGQDSNVDMALRIYANGAIGLSEGLTSLPDVNKLHKNGTILSAKIAGVDQIFAKLNGEWDALISQKQIMYSPIPQGGSAIKFDPTGKSEIGINFEVDTTSSKSINAQACENNCIMTIRANIQFAGDTLTLGLSQLSDPYPYDGNPVWFKKLFIKDSADWDAVSKSYSITSIENNEVHYLIIRCVKLDGVDGNQYEVTRDGPYIEAV